MDARSVVAEWVERNLRILGIYNQNACPCRFPRFVYWVTKEQHPGTDPLQNWLILSVLHQSEADVAAAVWRNDSAGGCWQCPTCGTKWLDVCIEKGNLNYAHRFVVQNTAPSPSVEQSVPEQRLSGSDFNGPQWEAFMVEPFSLNKAFKRTGYARRLT